MRLQLKTLVGKIIEVDLTGIESPTVDQLKEQIEDIEGIPAGSQRLILNDKTPLAPGRSLAEYNITDGSMIYLLLRTLG